MKLLKNTPMPEQSRFSKYREALSTLSEKDCLLCDESEVASLRAAGYAMGTKIMSRWMENHQAYGVWKIPEEKPVARRKAA